MWSISELSTHGNMNLSLRAWGGLCFYSNELISFKLGMCISNDPLQGYDFLQSHFQDGHHGLWLAKTIPAYYFCSVGPMLFIPGSIGNLGMSLISTTYTTLLGSRNQRWLPWPLIGRAIFDCNILSISPILITLGGKWYLFTWYV